MIINIASASARANFPFLAAYGSSKSAVAGLTEALAVELAPFGIKVKAIFPGAHATNIFTKVANGLMPDASAAPAAAAYRPYFANFLAAQAGVPKVTSPRSVARLIYRVALANSDQTDYLAGRDAVLQVLLKRLLPQPLFKRVLVSSLLHPPPRLILRVLSWLMGGTDPVEVDRSVFSQTP
jgi:NAD(P)-dependent dehydrogenase (short-subunit alcohol dehydrogenase family)